MECSTDQILSAFTLAEQGGGLGQDISQHKEDHIHAVLLMWLL